MDWSTLLFLALAAAMVLIGIVGTVLPAMPGPVFVLGGLLLAAWAEGWVYLSGWGIGLLVGLTALTFGVDFAATALGAKKLGASPRAALGAALGTLAGLFFGPIGLILGPFVGAVIGELTLHRDVEQAGRAGFGAWVGFVLGTVSKLAIVGTMCGIFLASRAF